MRIGVIEEVDEQMTMTSMRPETRPHVQSIFPQGPPPPSAPVDVPGNTRNGEIHSRSAPAGGGIMSVRRNSNDNETDEAARQYGPRQ